MIKQDYKSGRVQVEGRTFEIEFWTETHLDWAMRQIAEHLQREKDELEELRQINKFCGLSKGA